MKKRLTILILFLIILSSFIFTLNNTNKVSAIGETPSISGDKVHVHYHGKLNSGETFDTSAGREPQSFEVGSGSVIKGFDEWFPNLFINLFKLGIDLILIHVPLPGIQGGI